MIIYLDFDGTVVEHQYPIIGKHNPGSFEVIKKLQTAGHEIVLNTYRIEIDQDSFEEAMNYLNNSKIIAPITKYTTTKIHPFDWDLTAFINSQEIYIDDICKNIPLIDAEASIGKMVDWKEIDRLFKELSVY